MNIRSSHRAIQAVGAPIRRGLAAAILVLLVVGCLGGSTAMKGEIGDRSIVLAADHAGSAVRLILHNGGATPCELIVVLGSMAPTALPVEDGKVVVSDTGAPGTVRLPYGAGTTGFLARIQPGETFETEVALEGPPATDERIVLCDAAGDYQNGRWALLRFDR